MRAKVVKTKLNLNYFFVWKLGGGDLNLAHPLKTLKSTQLSYKTLANLNLNS